ncbi:hypothetical protein [Falsiroseomonas tokyonensis]|uniref:Uncharacterized protein n=1 Tax=Falsiroseomonas tokyonensis TaxID=430521 RepID=A0ABV7C0J9_9PROT|nr:hypothetical protein [Falsiroseomonas tokyonensis]MBU8540438.1 hypothetical protein [Falsiroseomonas tokyonensis]
MSTNPPPSLAARLRLDPAALPILVAAIVLVGAVAWLLSRPLPQASGDPAASAERVQALEARLASLEGRAGPDLAPLETRIAAAERAARAAADRPAVDTAQFAPRGALEGLAPRSALETLAPRSALETLAPRAAVEALGQRVDGLAQRAEAAIRQEEARATASSARIEGVARELATRLGTAEQAQAQAAQRIGTVESQLTSRIAALESALAERRAQAEAQAARIQELEGQAQRLAALEGRAGRLATLDQLRAALEAGRPLGGALGTLRDPPAALTRFAAAAPPTEAQLRLTFEDAARAARAASDPAREGQGVLDSAVSRLSSLVTVRRGEEVLWGDAAAAEIEKSRRALEAGDLEGSLAPLRRLSPPAQEAMRPWVEQAEALVAARAALRGLAAG